MFSSSFVSSATSGEETVRRPRRRRSRRARPRVACTPRSRPPTTFGVVFVVQSSRPGVDALGREGEVEVLAGLEAARLEQRRDPLARRARVGGRLEHDQLALLQPRSDLLAPRSSRIVRSGSRWSRERRRQRDEDRVGALQLVVVGGRAQQAGVDVLLQLLGRDVLDVALAAVQLRRRGRPGRRRARRVWPASGEDVRERHADVAGSDDGDVVLMRAEAYRALQRSSRPSGRRRRAGARPSGNDALRENVV